MHMGYQFRRLSLTTCAFISHSIHILQHLLQSLRSVPQQRNMTDCGVYVIAFVKLLCEGNNPTNPAIDFGPSQIQNLCNQIVVCLSHKYVVQQAIAQGIIDPTLNKPPVTPGPPSPARLPAPFPLSIDSLPQSLSKPSDQTLPSQLENDEYRPSINSWGMWHISGDLYYPAVTIPHAYAPAASDRAFWNGLDWSRLSRTLRAPIFLSDQPSMQYM